MEVYNVRNYLCFDRYNLEFMTINTPGNDNLENKREGLYRWPQRGFEILDRFLALWTRCTP